MTLGDELFLASLVAANEGPFSCLNQLAVDTNLILREFSNVSLGCLSQQTP
jgi:hypothetical protein